VNWQRFTLGLFDGVDWSNLFVAGGSVLGCLLPCLRAHAEEAKLPGFNGFGSSDIDLFVYGLEPAEATRKLHSVLAHLAKRMPECKSDILVRLNALSNPHNSFQVSPYSVTLVGLFPHRHVQVVLRIYRSPAEVLMGFDLDSACVGYDGTRV